MTKRVVVVALLLMVAGVSLAIPPVVIPIIYSAVRIGTQAYGLSTLAELGQSILGQSIKGLDASLAPIAETGVASGVRIPTASNAASVVPAPSAPAVGTPPHTTYTYSVPRDTIAQACQDYATANTYTGPVACSGQAGTMTYTVTSSVGPCQFSYQCVGTVSGAVLNSGTSSYSPTQALTCSYGYTNSAGVCNLSNARAAVQDGIADWQRTGTAFSKYAGDDTSTVDPWLSQQTITSSNDTLVISGMDSGQRPQKISVTNTADGGSTVTGITQKVDGAGATYTQTTVLTVNPSGVVTAAATTSQAQQMTQNPSTKTWTISAAPTSTYAPVATAGSAAAAFPSDYARQGEAASAAASINATLGPKLDKLIETSAAPADPLVPDMAGYTDFGNTFSSLLSWQLPGHTSTCPTASFMTPWSTSYTINSHCQLILDHWAVLQAAMMVVWTIGALFVVLRA